MIKVKVRPKNSQVIIHTVVTLLASTVDMIDDIIPFTSALPLSIEDKSESKTGSFH